MLSRGSALKLATLAFAVILSLVLAETTLRLFPGVLSEGIREAVDIDPSNYGIPHPYIGVLGTPNRTFTVAGKGFAGVAHTDAHGFRNHTPWPARADVVVVGDSVGFGYGVSDDEAWPAIVARKLAPAPLVNLSLIGAGPQQYVRIYETFGAALHPKLLVVGFFPENDFWDAAAFDEWEQSGVGGNYMVWRDFGMPERVPFDPGHPLVMARAAFTLHVYPLLRRSRLVNLIVALRRGARQADAGGTKTLRLADGGPMTLAVADFESKAGLAQAGAPAFRLARGALERLHGIASASGTHMVVVLQPGKEQAYLPAGAEPGTDVNGPLLEALRADGIECLDLTPAFREKAAAGERLFREVDGHPNEAGYALTAERVFAYIEQNRRAYGLER